MAGPRPARRPFCVGAPAFDPAARAADPSARAAALAHLERDDLEGAVRSYFALPARDAYVYHAVVSVTLRQAQEAVALGGRHGLHAWYWRRPAAPGAAPEPVLPPPPAADTAAYVAVFDPATATAAALRGLAANARRGSVRASVAARLLGRRFVHPARAAALAVPRNRGAAPANPYFDFWAWSARALEWAGPCAESEARPQSHHVLPVLMHHFGCAVPSYEALEVLRVLAAGRPVADVGSGGGYWAFMLRAHGVAVAPVDSAQSEWRVCWVRDTVVADGAEWLARPENDGGRGLVLLLVYPVVGGGVAGGVPGGFTRGLVEAYRGDTIAVVGTQNRNGYTGFRDMTMDEYMAREQPEWTRVVQIPLPSFAGKDEALFVFQRGDRAPKEAGPEGAEGGNE